MAEIRRSPVEVGSFPYYLQSYIHPRWLARFLPSTECINLKQETTFLDYVIVPDVTTLAVQLFNCWIGLSCVLFFLVLPFRSNPNNLGPSNGRVWIWTFIAGVGSSQKPVQWSLGKDTKTKQAGFIFAQPHFIFGIHQQLHGIKVLRQRKMSYEKTKKKVFLPGR